MQVSPPGLLIARDKGTKVYSGSFYFIFLNFLCGDVGFVDGPENVKVIYSITIGSGPKRHNTPKIPFRTTHMEKSCLSFNCKIFLENK